MNFKKALITIGSCCLINSCVNLNGVTIKGNGEIVDTELVLTSFEKIQNNCSADITYHVSSEYKVIFSTDSNLTEYVEIEIVDNILVIKTKRGSYSFSEFSVNVYSPELQGINISGSGDFICKEIIQTPKFEININGSGDIKGKFEVNTFVVNIRGSGKIKLTGSTDELKLSISGSGDFEGEKFISNHAEIKINGSGDVDVHVNESLNVQIYGSGDVRYSGKPTAVNHSIFGSGEVIKR